MKAPRFLSAISTFFLCKEKKVSRVELHRVRRVLYARDLNSAAFFSLPSLFFGIFVMVRLIISGTFFVNPYIPSSIIAVGMIIISIDVLLTIAIRTFKRSVVNPVWQETVAFIFVMAMIVTGMGFSYIDASMVPAGQTMSFDAGFLWLVCAAMVVIAHPILACVFSISIIAGTLIFTLPNLSVLTQVHYYYFVAGIIVVGVQFLRSNAFRSALAELRLEDEKNDFAQESLTDALTGLGNRRALMQRLATLPSKSFHSEIDYGVLVCDIDNFKQYNDCFSHIEGDSVLKKVSATLNEVSSSFGGKAYRYGGDEFVHVFLEADKENIEKAIEAMMDAIHKLDVKMPPTSKKKYLSMSFGLCYVARGKTIEPEAAFLEADNCLYQAKEHGKDRYFSTEI